MLGTFNPMTAILQATLKWTGFTGAPGYTNFYCISKTNTQPTQADADATANLLQNFAAYVRTYVPIEAAMQVQSDVIEIEDTNGAMQKIWSVGSRPVQQGQAASAPYSAASGLVVNWRTDGVKRGRRVRGRTFCVPLANSAYQSDGTIASSVLTSLNTNLATLIGGTNTAIHGVWSRPSAKGATDGKWFTTASFNIPDKVAVLRSRRD